MNLTGLSRVLTGFAFLSAAILVAQARYVQMTPAIIQQRLDLYKGNDTTREAALVRLFSEAGCSTGNLSVQPVPSRKQPNVICVLPGTTQATIVVGGHFDHVAEGEGIADNWSGASLLPSLFQSLAGSQRKHTFVFVGFTGVNGFGRSDEESFIEKRICTISVHSVTPETAHVLHSSSDNPTAIRFSDYYDTYRLLASDLAVLDTVEAPASTGCKVKPL